MEITFYYRCGASDRDMVLISIDEFCSNIVCPKCQSLIHRDICKYNCTNPGCIYSSELCFTIIEDQPILVDFEQSILDKDEVLKTSGASLINRKSNWLKEIAKKILIYNLVPYQKATFFKDLLTEISENPVVLIIGGGTQGYGTESFYNEPDIQLISFDIYKTPFTQFIADAHHIPLATETVDAVWIQNVLEHVLDPWQVVSEIYRVLKKGGIVYAETPFLQQVHEGTYDFTRFTESGHRWLFKNFELISCGVVYGPGHQLWWTIEHITRGVFRSILVGKLFKVIFFWVQYLDLIIPESYAIDDASSVFFMGKKR
jgi:SAM-dependent methyltransferase